MERIFMQRRAVIEMLLTVPHQGWSTVPAQEDPHTRWFRLLLDVRAGRVDDLVTFWESVPRAVFIT